MAELQYPHDSHVASRQEQVSILLVNDNPADLLSLRSILADSAYDLVEARPGEEVLARLNAQEFAVILLDLWVPGTGGLETAKLIRGRHRSHRTPIVFLTANDIDRAQLEQCYA